MARSLLDAIRKLRGARLAIALAAVVILGLVASRAATALYVDALWYREMGYASVFWRTFAWVWGVRLLVFLVVGSLIHLNLRVVTLKDVPTLFEPGEVVTVQASAPWYDQGRLEVRLPGTSRVTGPVVIALRAAGAVEGVVTGPDGRPLEDAEVQALAKVDADGLASQLHLQATSDAEGRYRLESVPPGAWLVAARRSAGPLMASTRVQLVAGPDDDSLSLRLAGEGGPDLSALQQAAEAAGAPVPGGQDAPGGVSGAMDTVVLDRLAQGDVPGALQRWLTRRPVEVWVPQVEVVARRTTRLDLVLPDGAIVSGRVTDGAGRPVPRAKVEAGRERVWNVPSNGGSSIASYPGLRVSLISGADGAEAEARARQTLVATRTNAQGEYVLPGLPPGEVEVAVADKAVSGVDARRTLTVSAGRRYDGVDLVVGGGLAITGRVFDAEGRPAAGARVALLPGEGAAMFTGDDVVPVDDDGSFAFTGLDAAPRRLWVSLDGYRSQWVEARPGGEPVRVDLQAAAHLVGRVTDAVTGRPVQDYSLRLETERYVMTNHVHDEDGRFDTEGVEEGPHDLTISAPGYRDATLTGVLPGYGEVPELDVRLQPEG